MDVRGDQTLFAPIEELDHVGAVPLGLALDERGPEHPDHRAAFEQHEVERNARDRAGSKAEHEIASLPGHRSQARLGGIAAHHIVKHIDAFGRGQLFEPDLEILVLVIDAVVGAVLAGEGELVA